MSNNNPILDLAARIKAAEEELGVLAEPLLAELEQSTSVLTAIAERMEVDMTALEDGMLARISHATSELLSND